MSEAGTVTRMETPANGAAFTKHDGLPLPYHAMALCYLQGLKAAEALRETEQAKPDKDRAEVANG